MPLLRTKKTGFFRSSRPTITGRRILTLNTNKFQSSDPVPFLKEEDFEIACLQEITEKNFFAVQAACRYEFGIWLPMQDLHKKDPDKQFERTGLAILSKTALHNVRSIYFGDFGLGDVSTPDTQPLEHPIKHALLLLVETCGVTLGCLHAPWTAEGSFTRFQQAAFERLIFMLNQVKGKFILCGDTNAPRGHGGYELLATGMDDQVPASVMCSLDPALHYARNHEGPFPQVMVDIILMRGMSSTDFKTYPGLSDHIGFSVLVK